MVGRQWKIFGGYFLKIRVIIIQGGGAVEDLFFFSSGGAPVVE